MDNNTVLRRVDYFYKGHQPFYSITISPPPRGVRDIDGLYLKDMLNIARTLNLCSQRYAIYPEFDHMGRLHYHGIIYIYNITKIPYVQVLLKRHLGFNKINPITSFISHMRWLIYCQKSYCDSRNKFTTLTQPLFHILISNLKKKYELQCNKLPKRKLINDYFINLNSNQ